MLVDDAQHDGQQRHAEDVIAVGEEASAGDQNGADVVPSKGGLVDLGEGQAAALVGVLDVSKVIVEVVEGVVPAGCLGGHDEALPMLGLQRLRQSREDKSFEELSQGPRNGLALELIYCTPTAQGWRERRERIRGPRCRTPRCREDFAP